MKTVFICSPLRGDLENTMERAKKYCRYAADQGVLPICPHIYCTQFLDDSVPEEREKGMNIGTVLLVMCTELWYWPAADGTISEGMQKEISLARQLGRPVIDMSKVWTIPA